MRKFYNFNFKAGDIVMFPDTETEYVDVEIGYVPVAQQAINTICQVVKRGRGLALRLTDDNYRSEVFNKRAKQYVSLRKYLDHFGTYDDLIKISR